MKDSYNDIFKNKKRILVVLAHPDDAEIICGGTIARLISDDKEVRLVVTTSGGKGMQERTDVSEADFSTERIKSQKDGAKALGLKDDLVFNLENKDGEFENSLENIEKIVFHIRQFKPDIVITHNPEDMFIHFFERSVWVNHNDHRSTGLVVADAVYPYSRDRGFFQKHFKDGLSPHIVNKLLIADSYTKGAVKYFAVDDYTEQKKKALQQHVSAFSPDDADGYVEENKFDNGYF